MQESTVKTVILFSRVAYGENNTFFYDTQSLGNLNEQNNSLLFTTVVLKANS
jgi:hypothetical protein